jgi:hypothetical protein
VTYTRKEIGDAVGSLFGVAVDACKSHHESHLAKPGVIERRVGTEISSATATSSQHCEPSWTGTAGETRLSVNAAGAMQLAAATMTMLEAGKAMSTQPNSGYPNPNQIQAGTTPVTIGIDAALPRGLYFGRLRSASGVALDDPVLIYIDGIS